MSHRPVAIALGICAALFAFAFVAAPHACEWGLVAYFCAGVASLLVLFAIPLVLSRHLPVVHRVGFGALLVLAGAGVWLAGMFVANVRIICKLF